MILTVQHASPPGLGVACNHCDDIINMDDDFKCVKFVFGEAKFILHEFCFLSVLAALNQFDEVFIKPKSTEPTPRLN
jgi:hypothetical protein